MARPAPPARVPHDAGHAKVFPPLDPDDVRAAALLAGDRVRRALRAAVARRPAAHRRGDRGAAGAHRARPGAGRTAQGRDGCGARRPTSRRRRRRAARPAASPRTCATSSPPRPSKERHKVDAGAGGQAGRHRAADRRDQGQGAGQRQRYRRRHGRRHRRASCSGRSRRRTRSPSAPHAAQPAE